MVIGAVLVFVNEVLAARLLGIRFYGFFALAFVLAKIGEIAATFGLQLAVVRFIPGFRVDGRHREVAGAITGSLVFPAVAGVLLAGAVYASSGWFATEVFNEPEAKRYIRYLAAVIPFLALANILGHVTRAFGRSVEQVLIRNLIPPVTFFIWLTVSHLVDAEPITVVTGFVFSYFFSTSLGTLIVARLLKKEATWTAPILRLRELYAYASHVFINSALLLTIGLTDVFMLGIFESAEQVGIYRGCLRVMLIFELVAFALGAVTTPLYSLLSESNDREKLREVYSMALHLASIMVIPAYLLISLNAADILNLLGPGFAAGSTALAIRAGGAAVKVAFSGAGLLLLTTNRQRFETGNAAVIVILNIILNLLLVPRFGIVGAASATVISLTCLSALRVIEVRLTLGLGSFGLYLPRYLAVCGILGLAVSYGAAAMGAGPGSGAALLALRLAGMGSILVAGLWIFGIQQEDKRVLLRVIRPGRGSSA